MNRYFCYKFKKVKTRDITSMGMMLGLYILFDYIAGWSMGPNFIVINIKFIPLFILAAYTDWLRTLIVCVIAGCISYLTPTNFDAGVPGAYVFDYFVPVMIMVLVSFVAPRNYDNFIKYLIVWIIIIAVLFFMFWVSRTFAGVLFYSSGNIDNKNVWIWSASVNLVNCLFDLTLFVLLVPSSCLVLKPLKNMIY